MDGISPCRWLVPPMSLPVARQCPNWGLMPPALPAPNRSSTARTDAGARHTHGSAGSTGAAPEALEA